jgi:hypothetical protein
MYDYNFPEQLTQERLILLLLSIVIPADTAVLKDIYKKKRELEDTDDSYRYPRGPYGWWNGGERYCPDDGWEGWCNLWSREFSKSLSLIRCLYPNFIMYAKSEDADPFISYYQLNDLHSLKKNNVMRDNGISVLNYIVDNWDSICKSDGNNMTGWRIKPSLEELIHFMDDQHTPFDILNERLNDFKYQIQAIMSMGELVELVDDSGILVDECGFINF